MCLSRVVQLRWGLEPCCEERNSPAWSAVSGGKGSGLAHAAVGYMSKSIKGDDNQVSHCQGREYNTEKEN